MIRGELQPAFEEVLNNPKQLQLLMEYAKERCCLESLKFIIAVDFFRSEVKRLAQEVVERFLVKDAEDWVPVSHTDFHKVQSELKGERIGQDIFEGALSAVLNLFVNDVFSKFEDWKEAKGKEPTKTKRVKKKKSVKELTKPLGSMNPLTSSRGDKTPPADVTSDQKVRILYKFLCSKTVGIPLKDKKFLGRKFHNCFSGSEAVDWLFSKEYQKREDCLSLLNAWFVIGVIVGENVPDMRDEDHAFYTHAFALEDLGDQEGDQLLRLKILLHSALCSEDELPKLIEKCRNEENHQEFSQLLKQSTTSRYDALQLPPESRARMSSLVNFKPAQFKPDPFLFLSTTEVEETDALINELEQAQSESQFAVDSAKSALQIAEASNHAIQTALNIAQSLKKKIQKEAIQARENEKKYELTKCIFLPYSEDSEEPGESGESKGGFNLELDLIRDRKDSTVSWTGDLGIKLEPLCAPRGDPGLHTNSKWKNKTQQVRITDTNERLKMQQKQKLMSSSVPEPLKPRPPMIKLGTRTDPTHDLPKAKIPAPSSPENSTQPRGFNTEAWADPQSMITEAFEFDIFKPMEFKIPPMVQTDGTDTASPRKKGADPALDIVIPASSLSSLSPRKKGSGDHVVPNIFDSSNPKIPLPSLPTPNPGVEPIDCSGIFANLEYENPPPSQIITNPKSPRAGMQRQKLSVDGSPNPKSPPLPREVLIEKSILTESGTTKLWSGLDDRSPSPSQNHKTSKENNRNGDFDQSPQRDCIIERKEDSCEDCCEDGLVSPRQRIRRVATGQDELAVRPAFRKNQGEAT